jgi:hypothetical protein
LQLEMATKGDGERVPNAALAPHLCLPSVKAGPAIVQLVNRGAWDGRLRRGRYRLWFTLEGHRALGMRATLRDR